ncbi:MAG: hypothetical protein GTN65_04860 [Armatimonadetes bacterium]|nr:hypothetical protein [Armatimonadota bacterium]NIO96428.1 hypothetical protein [Armatimonadota bacterium]
MDGLMWCLLVLLSYKYILTGICLLIGIVFFSVLAARAEARMWHAICRYNGERRAVQHQITLGKSHLR